MSEEYPIPERIVNDVMAFRSRNNTLVTKSAKLRLEMSQLVNKINAIEGERLVNTDSLRQMIRNALPAIGLEDFDIDFEEKRIEILPSINEIK